MFRENFTRLRLFLHEPNKHCDQSLSVSDKILNECALESFWLEKTDFVSLYTYEF